MNKQTIKQIKQIADRLPNVYEQCMSGGEWGYDEEGNKAFIPNIYNQPVNHVRRLRKAYEKLGMDGIKNYLEMIHNLQIKRNETAKSEIDSSTSASEGGTGTDNVQPLSSDQA